MSLIATGPSPTPSWPADRVERWPIERLIPYANNPRLHSEADLDEIAASIDEWGWTNPVLVDEQGVLIAGHCRTAAASKLGLKSIPVIVETWRTWEYWANKAGCAHLLTRPDSMRTRQKADPQIGRFPLGAIA